MHGLEIKGRNIVSMLSFSGLVAPESMCSRMCQCLTRKNLEPYPSFCGIKERSKLSELEMLMQGIETEQARSLCKWFQP